MRAIAIVLLSVSSLIATTAVRAEPSDGCKQCRDQQQACRKNYSASTCKKEYDICMKGCQKK